MRRWVVLCVMLGLLTGCQRPSKELQQVQDFRAQLLGRGGCTFQAEVEACYADYTSTFTLQCAYDAGTDTLDLTVQAPASIAGLTGQVAADRKTLTFTDTALEMPLLAGETTSPVALPQLLCQSWAGSYIVSGGKDHDNTVALYQNGYEDDTIKVETWFTDGLPVYADVWYRDRCQAGVTISEFQFN